MRDREPLTGYPDLSDADRIRRAEAFEASMRTRRSVRAFSGAPVPRAIIESAIRTASRAPNGANKQPWTFVAVSDPVLKQRVRVAAEAEERAFYGGRAPQAWLDALARTPAPMTFLREVLGRPEHERPFLLVVTGLPARDATVPRIEKKPLGEVAVFVEGGDTSSHDA
jgi:nitroreductase